MGIACALVIVASFVKTMIPLRWLAVASNIGFVVYGALHPSWPMLALNAALLPVNLYRVREMTRLTRQVTAAATSSYMSGLWLRPYMRSTKMRAGDVLFRQGDRGDSMYMLADGEVEFVEIGQRVSAGSMFGEIAFFSPDQARRLTARCATDCTLLSIDEATVKELYYQNPTFGFELIRLVAGRLVADVERLRGASARGASLVNGERSAD
ncbi:MAG: cyclic nucleotide-binding domain-containing protein [Proteobacteria bacterium]|nr:cyclic nucleotide-binding domain-containing protein [Pseudomonadota bacterium]